MQTLPSLDGVDRRCRFDLREGHDLERLLWPGTGSGDSTGLLQNFAVDDRRFATVEPIKSAPSRLVKHGRSSNQHRQDERATPPARRRTTTASQCRKAIVDSSDRGWSLHAFLARLVLPCGASSLGPATSARSNPEARKAGFPLAGDYPPGNTEPDCQPARHVRRGVRQPDGTPR